MMFLLEQLRVPLKKGWCFATMKVSTTKKKVKSKKVRKILKSNSYNSFFLFFRWLKTMIATIEVNCCHIRMAVDHSECFTCHNFSSSLGPESLPLSAQQAMVSAICWSDRLNLIFPSFCFLSSCIFLLHL